MLKSLAAGVLVLAFFQLSSANQKDERPEGSLGLTTSDTFAHQVVLDGLAAMRNGDCERAVSLLEPLEVRGPAEAWKLLGDMYKFGRCKPVDHARAFRLYSVAAEKGLALAQYNLAVAYDKGEGTAADLSKAVQWYLKAAVQGQADAQSNLAVLYFTGRGVERNDAKGAALTESAAMQGYAPAQDNLGKVYWEGIGKPKDLIKAELWHRKAAEQGYSVALLNLGAFYEMGWVVQRNLGLAYTHYLLAQRAGYGQASENLNRLRKSLSSDQLAEAERIADSWRPGMSLPISTYDNAVAAFKSRRFGDAVALWEKGAQEGNSESQFQLGVLFAAGVHVERDLKRATSYLQLAADASHREAAYALAAIYATADQGRPDEVMKMLLLSERLGDETAKISLVLIRSGLPLRFALRLDSLIGKQEALLPPSLSANIDVSPSAMAAGAQIVKTTCGVCHTTGAAGAPLLRRQSDWDKRRDDPTTVAKRIIRGYKACPPKGGNYALTDDEVRTAITYMLGLVRK